MGLSYDGLRHSFFPLELDNVEADIRRTIHKHLEMVQKDTFKVPAGPLIGLPLDAEGLGVLGMVLASCIPTVRLCDP